MAVTPSALATWTVQSVYQSLGATPAVYVNSEAINFSYSFIDTTPNVGTNNYKLQTRLYSGGCGITSISLTGIVYKK